MKKKPAKNQESVYLVSFKIRTDVRAERLRAETAAVVSSVMHWLAGGSKLVRRVTVENVGAR